ncbi:MAG: peptidoglycan DD-metalloendopeptidase family protein [Patescibacteria group bacterium]
MFCAPKSNAENDNSFSATENKFPSFSVPFLAPKNTKYSLFFGFGFIKISKFEKIGFIFFIIAIVLLIKRGDFSFAQKVPTPTTDFQENFLSSINYENSINPTIAIDESGDLNSLSVLSILNKDKTWENYEEVIHSVVLPSNNNWKYIVKKNETLSHIAYKFKVSEKTIIALNQLNKKNTIIAGQTIYLPPGVNVTVASKNNIIAKIPLVGRFVEALTPIGNWLSPVSGYDQPGAHSNNGVDVSAECGKPVYSANSGMVIESSNGWNDGYGTNIRIQHSDGVMTLYGHLSERYVNQGDYVEKGTLVASVGNTGNVSGPTGCHLHFEVRGGKNFLLR